MTKFDPVAIAERRGRDRANPSAAERRLRMEKFRTSGAHPELERDEEDVARRARVERTMTGRDATRAKAFLDIAVAGAHGGSVVIELLEDAAPRAARRFEARLDDGDDDGGMDGEARARGGGTGDVRERDSGGCARGSAGSETVGEKDQGEGDHGGWGTGVEVE